LTNESRSEAMNVREQVREFNQAFERALLAQDAEALVSLYREDARIQFPGEPAIQGRAAIETVMRAWVEDGPVSIRFESEQILSGDELVVDVGSTVQGNGRRGKYVVVHRREADGTLRIAVDSASGNG
jgi:uncharacterized protein (TIGR02246 family)